MKDLDLKYPATVRAACPVCGRLHRFPFFLYATHTARRQCPCGGRWAVVVRVVSISATRVIHTVEWTPVGRAKRVRVTTEPLR